jgi:hypothetical protein
MAALLGKAPIALPAYDSYGMIDPKTEEKAILAAVEAGFQAIKIKLGEGDLEVDMKTVRAVRAMIGPTIRLMVDYNQSLDPVEACRRIARLVEFDLCWVEEPVSAEDLEGHARVRAATSLPIQTGENWWFPRDMAKAIAVGASDFGMLDVMKIGGVTGWLSAMGQAEAASLPISSHISRPAHICSRSRRPLIGSDISISPAPFSRSHTAPSMDLLRRRCRASVLNGAKALSLVSLRSAVDQASQAAGAPVGEIHVTYKPAILSRVWPICC